MPQSFSFIRPEQYSITLERNKAPARGGLVAFAPQKKGPGRLAEPLAISSAAPPQRFENWKLRRAFILPYFLRSTTRLSRVRKPPFLSTGRNSGSN